jgi:hypothetical protein
MYDKATETTRSAGIMLVSSKDLFPIRYKRELTTRGIDYAGLAANGQFENIHRGRNGPRSPTLQVSTALQVCATKI